MQFPKKTVLVLLIMFFNLQFLYAKWYASKIEDIEIESTGDITKVSIFISKKAKLDYKIDRYPSPNRLIIDFKEIGIGDLDKNSQINQGIIKNIKIRELQDKKGNFAEIIIEVAEFSPYYVIEDEGTISLQFENSKQITIPKKALKKATAVVAKADKIENIAEVKEVSILEKKELETKAEIKTEPPKVEQKKEPELETKAEIKIEPKVEQNKEPKPEIKAEIKTEPKIESKPEIPIKTPSPLSIVAKIPDQSAIPAVSNEGVKVVEKNEIVEQKIEEKKVIIPEINEIKIEEKEGQSIIKIYSSEPVDYKMLELPAKHFLVLDIPFADNKIKDKELEVNGPIINRIRSGQYQKEPFKIVRIVIELKENRPYFTNKKDSEISVIIDRETPMPITVSDKPKEQEQKPIVSKQIPQEEKISEKIAAFPVQKEEIVPAKKEKQIAQVPETIAVPQSTRIEETKDVPSQEVMDERDLEKLISLDFKDAEIGNLLRMLSFASNINIVTSSEVKGTMTIRIDKVPWETALTNILEVNGLAYQKKGNVIYVAKKETFKTVNDKTQTGETSKPVFSLISEIVTLNYIKANSLINLVSKLLSARGKIDIDERTNSFIISDMSNNIEEIKKILKKLDSPTPQIIIESMLVDINATKINQLGIQWIVGKTKENLADLSTSETKILASGVLSNTQELRDMISNQTEEKDVNILSNLKIATLDNEEAKILLENQVPIQFIDNNNQTTQLVPLGIKLKVKPDSLANGNIIMKINHEISGVKKSNVEGINLEVSTNEIETNIEVKNGQTIVIGGLLHREESKTDSGVPIFKRIPLFGSLFSDKTQQPKEKHELMIFITPYVGQ